MSPEQSGSDTTSPCQSATRYVAVCSEPIFIFGSPRSGTSILAWSLAQHDHLWTSEESEILLLLYGQSIAEQAYAETTATPVKNWITEQGVSREEFLAHVGLGINALFTSRSGERRWIDQTPSYTLIADKLADLFPDARFLHILRNGPSVVNSMIHFLDPLDEATRARRVASGHIPPWALHFKDACQTWREYVTAALDFCERHPGRALTVVNEQLTADPQGGFARILAFLEVSPSDAPALYFNSHRINSSFTGGTEQEDAGPWQRFTLEQKILYLEETGSLLEERGLTSPADLTSMRAEVATAQQDLWLQIQEIARTALPASTTVLVVSRGDDRLCQLGDRTAWHFPRGSDGTYAGYYPANSDEAIGHLEVRRTEGAAFILFPNSAFWWLEYYDGFRAYLEMRYRLAVSTSACRIYDLSPAGGASADEAPRLGRMGLEGVTE